MAFAIAGPILGNSSMSAGGAVLRSIGYRSTASAAAASTGASSEAAGEATSPAPPSPRRAPPGNEPTTMPSATKRRTLRSSRVTGAPLPGVRVHFLRDIGGPFVRLDPA
jgi:hypothetical protein